MRGVRAAALILVLPLAGCIVAVDQGGRKGLEKRMNRLEKRIEDLERGAPPLILNEIPAAEPAR